MLSNYGLGFAVFGDRFADGQPVEDSWLLREGAEDFARLVDYQDGYARGMRRFDTPLRANPMLIGMLEAACNLLEGWGAARVEAYLRETAAPAVQRLRDAGFGVADSADRAANLFGVALPAGLQPESARRIHVSVRGSSVRVAPHVYNDGDDLMRLADALIAMR
jgi:selenocysteine lyase/cysteine desulfurase